MNSADFGELYCRAGLDVYEYGSKFWLKINQFIVGALPTLEPINISHYECLEIMFKSKAQIATFISSEQGIFNSSEYIYDFKTCTLEDYDSKTRNQIRKGLKLCKIDRPSLKELKGEALSINRLVLLRQHRKSFLGNSQLWSSYIEYLYHRNDVQILGAFVGNSLIAYTIFIQLGSRIAIYHPFMDQKYSSMNPIMALLYSGISNEFRSNGPSVISYGLKSYRPMSSLDVFKRNMRFHERPICRAFVTRRRLNPIFSDTCSRMLNFMANLKVIPENIYSAYMTIANGYEREE